MKVAVTDGLRSRTQPIRIGTMCSGSELTVSMLREFKEAVAEMLEEGQTIDFLHVFSCENEPWKREWIKKNFPDVGHLFGDVRELASSAASGEPAVDHLSDIGSKFDVPRSDYVFIGFSC